MSLDVRRSPRIARLLAKRGALEGSNTGSRGEDVQVAITVEKRFARTPDGRVWTSGEFAYRFWARYLKVFETVKVIARVEPVAHPSPGWVYADGPSVQFVDVPYYVGPLQFAVKADRVRRVVSNAVSKDDAVILRVPSTIATTIMPFLWAKGHPYALEVVGDPLDVFAPGSIQHPLRGFFRWWYARNLKQQCLRAAAISYVTEQALQLRYPPAQGAYTTHYSSVELGTESFVTKPRCHRTPLRSPRLVSVGSLQTLYKGPDVAIDALAILKTKGVAVQLTWLGDGQHRSHLEQRARAAGVQDRVQFLGQLPSGAAVREQLDSADVFILPSRAEGLPRAMIEAMARALPCVGTNVGGIGELLDPEDLVDECNPLAVANKVEEVINDPRRLDEMSARNLLRAQSYRDEVLDARRTDFYRFVRELASKR